jgi:hypothetical protein
MRSRGFRCNIARPCRCCAPMSIGFKEWALICDALGRGEQSIILRKGGIAEGRAGFRFAHESFFLFPTLFHEQVSKLKLPATTPLPAARSDGQIELKYRARVEWTHEINDLEAARRLAPFHLWNDEVIAERFRYDEKQGISLAFVRVSQLLQPLVFANSPRYGGCRSWVELPAVDSTGACVDALDDERHAQRQKEVRALL